jgi:hypothetical protein
MYNAKVGNQVHLNSNPEVPLTIIDIADKCSSEAQYSDCLCRWFSDGGVQHQSWFPQACLTYIFK